MSGIYVHIPYCRQKCIYCDFYSTASRQSRTAYIAALEQEAIQRKDYLLTPVRTMYFGGGTPTVLTRTEMEEIYNRLSSVFDLSNCMETTIEANPENLSGEYLSFLRRLGFNRLSIGIQSFNPDDLIALNRRHSCQQATESVRMAKEQGFDNISIDLMFNLPGMNMEKWKGNLDRALQLDVEHISCYSLTREEGTMLDKMIKAGKTSLPNDEECIRQFNAADEILAKNGYRHYEISNYCKVGKESIHNSSYWQQIDYIGLGASAHSFNKTSRQWNPSSIEQYINNINTGAETEKEILSDKEKYNEYIMLSLRTEKGIDITHIKKHFPQFLSHYEKQLEKVSDMMSDRWILSNRIAVELML